MVHQKKKKKRQRKQTINETHACTNKTSLPNENMQKFKTTKLNEDMLVTKVKVHHGWRTVKREKKHAN